MDGMNVPPSLTAPDEATEEYRRQVDRVNEYLTWARAHMKRLSAEVDRLGKVRGDAVLQNGPNGIILA